LTLFQLGDFVSHNGNVLKWKIECEALNIYDWHCLAHIISHILPSFGLTEGVPRGGLMLAESLRYYIVSPGPLLIVDDVLTTGKSMEEQRAGRAALGVVVFARAQCPKWITPVFQMPY